MEEELLDFSSWVKYQYLEKLYDYVCKYIVLLLVCMVNVHHWKKK